MTAARCSGPIPATAGASSSSARASAAKISAAPAAAASAADTSAAIPVRSFRPSASATSQGSTPSTPRSAIAE